MKARGETKRQPEFRGSFSLIGVTGRRISRSVGVFACGFTQRLAANLLPAIFLLCNLVSFANAATPNSAEASPRLLAQAPAQSVEIASDKQDAYRDVTNKLEALQKEEKDLIRRGYREEHPLIQAVRSQLRELSMQKAELEHPAPKSTATEDLNNQSEPTAVTKLAAAPVLPQSAVGSRSASTVPGRSMDSLDDKQKLGVGDRVTFRVVEDQEDPKPLTVTDAGELDVPELGLVSAAGKTCKQLAFEIKPKLEQTTYYHATVIIGIDLLNKTMSGRRAYVSGQVLKAGPQEIPAGETWTVTKAILRAGGFTDFADEKHVRLVRGGSKGVPGKTLILNVDEVLKKGRTDLDQSVEPEDLIYVPARALNF
jgi:protein involved in polysaccharide export with SLBB domain